MASIIQVRRGTANEWSLANTVLSEGEYGYVTDEKRIKIGDGTTAWNTLSYLLPFTIGELIDVSNAQPQDKEFISYDSSNNQWIFRNIDSSDILPIQSSTGDNIIEETNGTVYLDNISLGPNVSGLANYGLVSNVYKLFLSDNDTTITMYEAESGDDVTLTDSDNYIISLNANFQIVNNNLVLVL